MRIQKLNKIKQTLLCVYTNNGISIIAFYTNYYCYVKTKVIFYGIVKYRDILEMNVYRFRNTNILKI